MKKLQKVALGLVVLGLLGMASCGNNSEKKVDANEADSHTIVKGEALTEAWGNAVVGIYYKEDQKVLCTGTLIHPKWVLTSAGCVAASSDYDDDSPGWRPEDDEYDDEGNVIHRPYLWHDADELAVVFGKNYSELKKHQHKIKNIYFHEKWGELDVPHDDIALIELAQPVSESVAYPIPPITPENGVLRSQLAAKNTEVTVVGFGTSGNSEDYGTKVFTKVPLLDNCGASNDDSIEGCESHKKQLAFGTLYYEFAPGGSCGSDEGGPLIIKTDDFPGMAVVGVTSFSYTDSAYGKARCGKFSVDTAVQDFYESFIMKYAPEVKTYHEARLSKLNDELTAGVCSDGLNTFCRAMSDDKEISECTVNDPKTVECVYACEAGVCSLCQSDGAIKDVACNSDSQRTCKDYQSNEIADGATGCVSEIEYAKCENGKWVDNGYCWSDPNGVGSCSTEVNSCKLTCKDGYKPNNNGTQCVLENKGTNEAGSCKTYDGLYVKDGERGCFDKQLIATCRNGEWMELDFCEFDQNTKSACSNNACEMKCKQGYINAESGVAGCVSVKKGADCIQSKMVIARDGEWYCEDDPIMEDSTLYQCVDGKLNKKSGKDCDWGCDADGVGNRCALAGCEDDRGYLLEHLSTSCVEDETAMATCYDGEWIHQMSCANGCDDNTGECR